MSLLTAPLAPDARERLLRSGLLAALLLTNPLLWAWSTTTGGVYPDSIAYLTLSRSLLQDGRLAIEGLQHADSGLILPPLYSLLTGIGTRFFGDAILVSQWLSGAALLLAVVPLFLWVARIANPWLAAATVAVVQWHPAYFRFGTSTLTEGLFVLGVAATGYATARLLAQPAASRGAYAVLGAGAALVYLTRQIGLFLLPGIACAIVLSAWSRREPGAARAAMVRCGLLGAGFLSLAAPHAAVLHAQTGQGPWTQSYRLNRYVVAEAESSRAALPASETYEGLYLQRRQLRRLNADATEMLGNQVRNGPEPSGPLRWLSGPRVSAQNLAANIGHASALLGSLALLLAAGALIPRRDSGAASASARLTLAALSLNYLLLLSLLTGLVPRYVEAFLPFAIAMACVGVHELAQRLPRLSPAAGLLQVAVAVAAAALLVVSSPAATSTPPSPKHGERPNPFGPCRELVSEGAAIFAFHPLLPYLLGGHYRVMPNDSLDRIAAYGRRTGTRWLAYRRSEGTEQEVQHYDPAGWMRHPDQMLAAPDYALRCVSPDGSAALFEIRGETG